MMFVCVYMPEATWDCWIGFNEALFNAATSILLWRREKDSHVSCYLCNSTSWRAMKCSAINSRSLVALQYVMSSYSGHTKYLDTLKIYKSPYYIALYNKIPNQAAYFKERRHKPLYISKKHLSFLWLIYKNVVQNKDKSIVTFSQNSEMSRFRIIFAGASWFDICYAVKFIFGYGLYIGAFLCYQIKYELNM